MVPIKLQNTSVFSNPHHNLTPDMFFCILL